MSAITKRKHVIKEVHEDFSLPKSNQTIVRIMRNAGSNLHEVETAKGEYFHASLPMKFRGTWYIKRGDFVITEPIVEGNKVKGEIVRILLAEHIKEIHKAGVWPKEFDELVLKKYGVGKKQNGNYFGAGDAESGDEKELPANPNHPPNSYDEEDCSSDDSDDDIPMNPNHPPQYYDDDDSSSDDDSDDDEEEETVEQGVSKLKI